MNRFFVFGAGGIGLLLQYLIGKNDDCILIARRKTKDRLLSEKLKIEGAIEDSLAVVCKTIDDIDSFSDQDIIFIATKAQDALALVESISSKLAPKSVIVLCQNGIGIFESAKDKYPDLFFEIELLDGGSANRA